MQTFRSDELGPLRLMAQAEGYVMVRRRGCAPRVMSLAEWLTLPLCDKHGALESELREDHHQPPEPPEEPPHCDACGMDGHERDSLACPFT